MSDFLLDLAQNTTARKVITTLGLPVPMPAPLQRGAGAIADKDLAGRVVIVDASGGGELHEVLAEVLAEGGADLRPLGSRAQLQPYERAALAHGVALSDPATRPIAPSCLVVDATAVTAPEGLDGVYKFLHDWVPLLSRSGRVAIVGRASDAGLPAAHNAVTHALVGLTKSLAKEIGKKGATCNLLALQPGAAPAARSALRFLLSARSAFVSGQRLEIAAAGDAALSTAALHDKVVIVTGAARGIGAAIATLCAREGARVLCVDRSVDKALQAVADSVQGVALGLDVSAGDAGAKLVAAAQAMGTLWGVVHNAGITRDKTLARMDFARWRSVMNVNLDALVRSTPALIDAMGGEGRVVCLSSISGIAGNMGQTNYAASKAGVIGLVQSLQAHAPQGVTVNAIAPGFIETQMTAAIPPAVREVARRFNALSQGGQPEDVAEAVVAMLLPQSAGVRGQVLRVCGLNMVGA